MGEGGVFSGVMNHVCSLLSGDHFPLEARHHLAPWLDQNFSTDLDLANPQHEEHAQRLVLELVAQLESKVRRYSIQICLIFLSLGSHGQICLLKSFGLFASDKYEWLHFPLVSWARIRLEYFDQNEVLLSIKILGNSLINSGNSFQFCVPNPHYPPQPSHFICSRGIQTKTALKVQL